MRDLIALMLALSSSGCTYHVSLCLYVYTHLGPYYHFHKLFEERHLNFSKAGVGLLEQHLNWKPGNLKTSTFNRQKHGPAQRAPACCGACCPNSTWAFLWPKRQVTCVCHVAFYLHLLQFFMLVFAENDHEINEHLPTVYSMRV